MANRWWAQQLTEDENLMSMHTIRNQASVINTLSHTSCPCKARPFHQMITEDQTFLDETDTNLHVKDVYSIWQNSNISIHFWQEENVWILKLIEINLHLQYDALCCKNNCWNSPYDFKTHISTHMNKEHNKTKDKRFRLLHL